MPTKAQLAHNLGDAANAFLMTPPRAGCVRFDTPEAHQLRADLEAWKINPPKRPLTKNAKAWAVYALADAVDAVFTKQHQIVNPLATADVITKLIEAVDEFDECRPVLSSQVVRRPLMGGRKKTA